MGHRDHKSVDESRHLLEANGIALQSEQMLFQFLPDPALPTEIELSMAERLSKDDIETNIEVYIPQRIDFLQIDGLTFVMLCLVQ